LNLNREAYKLQKKRKKGYIEKKIAKHARYERKKDDSNYEENPEYVYYYETIRRTGTG